MCIYDLVHILFDVLKVLVLENCVGVTKQHYNFLRLADTLNPIDLSNFIQQRLVCGSGIQTPNLPLSRPTLTTELPLLHQSCMLHGVCVCISCKIMQIGSLFALHVDSCLVNDTFIRYIPNKVWELLTKANTLNRYTNVETKSSYSDAQWYWTSEQERCHFRFCGWGKTGVDVSKWIKKKPYTGMLIGLASPLAKPTKLKSCQKHFMHALKNSTTLHWFYCKMILNCISIHSNQANTKVWWRQGCPGHFLTRPPEGNPVCLFETFFPCVFHLTQWSCSSVVY